MDEKTKQALTEILERVSKLEKKIMMNQAQLDAAIAALPGQIESAVTTALQPVIVQIQSVASAAGVDLTNEVNSLNAIPAAVASAVATAVSGSATSQPNSGTTGQAAAAN
jgi:hypothetical protein